MRGAEDCKAGTATGLCVISVPKSGTMFLSRYLERVSGLPVVFGLEGVGQSRLAAEIDGREHPLIKASRHPGSLATATRRYALMLSRNRQQVDRLGLDAPRLYSDHGFHNFLRFLLDPRPDEIVSPEEILSWAEARRLRVCYLYRDLGAILVSLANFLSAGKSFLLSIDGLENAMNLSVELYAPVLAAHIEAWRPFFSDPRLMVTTYKELTTEPAAIVSRVAAGGGIPLLPDAQLIDEASEYKPWTYRGGKKLSWRDSMAPRHIDALTERYPSLMS